MARHRQTIEKLAALSRKKYKLGIEADWRYRYFFQFLQISPSYELARLHSAGRLDPKSPLPRDFALVQQTFAAFGSLREIDFWDWWLQRAQFQFGTRRDPLPSVIKAVGANKPLSAEGLAEAQHALKEYLEIDWPQDGFPATLILAIPVSGSLRRDFTRIKELLAKHSSSNAELLTDARYQVIRDKTREATLSTAMRVLRARAALPKHPLYKIGNRAKIQSQYETDENEKLRNSEQRRLMEILVSRHLHRAYLFAENAARGKFPSLARLPEDHGRPRFDWVELNGEFRRQGQWMQQELRKLKERQKKQKRGS